MAFGGCKRAHEIILQIVFGLVIDSYLFQNYVKYKKVEMYHFRILRI